MIGLDELGPVAARRSSGPSWSDDAYRPHFRPSYARHGYRWAFGALAHRSGAAFVETTACRDTTAWRHFLDGLETFAPDGDAFLIVDALPLHWSVDTLRWNWGHPRFHFVPLPKAAAWLNLMEGFWKILTQRALAGRDCTSPQRGRREPCPLVRPIGISTQHPSSGAARPSPSAASSANLSIGFKERCT